MSHSLWPTDAQIARWSQFSATPPPLGEGEDRLKAHKAAYEEAFERPALPPFVPLWYPEYRLELGQTNLGRALKELEEVPSFRSYAQSRRPGETLYEPLHRWSVTHRAEFWAYVLFRRLQVPFQNPPTRLLSFPTGDITQPVWLEGARGNINDLLFRAAESATALVYGREEGPVERWSYAALRQEVQRVAGAFLAQGLKPGDRIALCLPLRPEAVFLYLGAIYAGLSAVTIPDSLSGEEIAARLRIARPKRLFIQDGLYREGRFLPLYERVQPYDLPPTYVLAGRGSIQTRLRNNAFPWSAFLQSEQVCSEPIYGPPDREIGVLFSSGTTATPKAIPWTYLTALKAITDAHFFHDVQPSDVLTWPTNLGWMMGPWLLFAGLAHGATVALYEGAPTGAGFCQFVAQQRVTILGVVPSLVRRWIESQAWQGADWSAIRLFSSTGEASNPWHMWALMAKAGYKPIIEYCGGTEIGGGYITSTLLHPNAPSQFSAPALGLDFVLLDESGQPAEEGEIFLIGPSIGLSQKLLNADHTQVYYEGTPALQAGWVGATHEPIASVLEGCTVRLRRHGDFLRRLPTGYWVSGGRADDAMNLGGIKIASVEIERVVAQVPGVGEAAAVAVPPPEGGPEQLVVYVVPQAEAPTDPSYWKPLLAQVIRERLSPLFHLHAVVVVPELPRTASNKIMRRLLRRAYLERQQTG
ncbi:MAG: AMP-binding protein [Bacteroidia bacterium]|nr:AMP-binding protein [Bacteroidia bacterium]MDW8089171.1 AMP-binding protein [Bacteroidia bacterium]